MRKKEGKIFVFHFVRIFFCDLHTNKHAGTPTKQTEF